MRWSAAAAGLPIALWLAPAAGDPGLSPTAPDAVLEALTAADRARAELAAARAAWAREQAQQAALADALRAEAARLRRQARAQAAQAEAIAADPDAAASATRLAALRAEAEAADARIRSALAPLAARWSAPAAEPGLRGALGLLRAAEQAAGEVEVEVQTGRLGDREVAVQILRLGLAAMWWRALDGQAAGVVEVVDGQRVLRPLDAAGQAAVAEAIAVAARQIPPRLVDLPVEAR